MSRPTACRSCVHLIKDGKIWYDQHCYAVPSEKHFDSYTGKMMPDDDSGYKHCRDVNLDGNCPHYETEENRLSRWMRSKGMI